MTSLYDEVYAGFMEDIESEFSDIEGDIMDLMAIVKEGSGFRSTIGGVRD